MCLNMIPLKEKKPKAKSRKQSSLFRGVLFAAIIGLFLGFDLPNHSAVEFASMPKTKEDLKLHRNESALLLSNFDLPVAILLLIALSGLLYYYIKKVKQWKNKWEDEVVYSNNLVEEKTNLLTHIAHEIRAPLNALINITEMLGSQEQDQIEPESLKEQKKLTDTAHYHVRTVSNTITDILSLTKLEEVGL